jgi:GPH family glycoside/pentoside/hexuronide:cation symporter
MRFAYTGGQVGASISIQFVSTFVLVYYLPATGERPNLIPGLIGGIGTYLLLTLLARGIDSFFDAWIANRSDRSRTRFGRRRSFMLAGALPLSLSTAMLFFAPGPVAGVTNVAWLAFWLTLYFCALSVWYVPYLALLPELAPDRRESSFLSTLQAACALLGSVIASVIAPALFLSNSDADPWPLQRMAVGIAILSFVFLLLPPLAIDDSRGSTHKTAATLSLTAALRHTFRDRAFVLLMLGTNLFFFAFTVTQTGLPFVVQVLLERPLREQGQIMGPLFLVSLVSFPVVLALSRKIGNRAVMLGATLSMALLVGAGIPVLHPGAKLGAVLIFGAIGVPIAAFLAVPVAMLSDVCNANARRTGLRGEAMFFGASGFIQKLMIGAAAGVVSWLMEAFGKTVANPLGVQLSAGSAALALLLAAACFWLYPEKSVHDEANRR